VTHHLAPLAAVPAAATTLGSMPGTSVRSAVAAVVGSMTSGDGVPHLPELPARGPGADLVGRTAGLLASVAPDLAVETTPAGWRFADAPGRESRRARSWLGEDLDAWEEGLEGYAGPVAVSLAGPWTVAAAVELRTGERAVRDPGACRDLAEALQHAAVDHVADVRRRLPSAQVSLWLDEPSLPAVLQGTIPTQSGLARYAGVDEPVVETALRRVVDALHAQGVPVVVHCCGSRPPYALFHRSGFDAVSADLLLHDRRDDDAIGELLEAGRRLVAGVLPATDAALSEVRATVGLVRELGHRLGHGPDVVAERVLVSPTCGLAGASDRHVRAVLEGLRAVGRGLREEEGTRGED
jgi:methionine synthase II (cobalamin-independent)